MKREEDMERIRLYNDDCLNTFKLIEDKTIDLILIDPPYNIGKDKWDKWATVELYVEFMGKVFKECERVLKDNGSFYFFHNDFLQIVELQNWINKNSNFIFKQLITWNKKHFKKFAWLNRNPETCKDRNWFPNVEYCLYYTFQEETGLEEVLQRENFSKISERIKNYVETNFSREYVVDLFLKEGRYSNIQSAKVHASYKMGWNRGRRFDLMDEKLYNFLNHYLNFPFVYKELKEEYEEIRQEYEELRYTFNLKEVQENISCVWENDNKNNGKFHSCEKPLDILEKIIKTSSNENDVVLDCFMGSGSTGVACANTNRRFIGIEKEEKYFGIAKERIEKASNISFF